MYVKFQTANPSNPTCIGAWTIYVRFHAVSIPMVTGFFLFNGRTLELINEVWGDDYTLLQGNLELLNNYLFVLQTWMTHYSSGSWWTSTLWLFLSVVADLGVTCVHSVTCRNSLIELKPSQIAVHYDTLVLFYLHSLLHLNLNKLWMWNLCLNYIHSQVLNLYQ